MGFSILVAAATESMRKSYCLALSGLRLVYKLGRHGDRFERFKAQLCDAKKPKME